MQEPKGAGKTALVTGASSGIGLELCRLLAADGYGLIISARRVERLREIAQELAEMHGIPVHVVGMDLSRPYAAEKLWNAAREITESVDVLVNNAGAGMSGDFAKSDPEELERMLHLDVCALSLLARHALPGMIAKGRGSILNLASLAAFQPGGPGMAAYYASKNYVLAFSRGLRRELRHSGVSVTALCPGPTESEFGEKSGAHKQRLFRWLSPMSARTAALAGYRGMQLGCGVVVPGRLNKLLAFGGELPPRFIAMEVNRFLLRQG